MHTAIGIICFLLSNLGIYNYIRRKTCFHISFIPILVITIEVSVLILAGILNILTIVIMLMTALGLFFFLADLVKKRAKDYSNFIGMPFLYLGICMVVLAFLLQDSVLTGYDNFSHWAVVVKDMFVSHQMPSYKSEFVMFESYPLGSSIYIYYFCTMFGKSETMQMLAQAFMIVCAILPIFSCIKKPSVFSFLYILAFTNFILVYLIPITDLCVDTLLPLVGMASLLFVYQSCSPNVDHVQNPKELLYAVPFLITTLMIKNSGIFFVLLCDAVILSSIHKIENKDRKYYISALMLPYLSLIIWQKHCAYVFEGAGYSKHSMNLSNYRMQVHEKTWEDILNLGKECLSYMYSRKVLIFFVLSFAALIVLTFLFCKQKKIQIFKITGAIFLIYLLYSLGIWGMYVFSMPVFEAGNLEGLSRYAATIDIAVFYLLICSFLNLPIQSGYGIKVNCTVLVILLLLCWSQLTGFRVVSGNKINAQREWLENQISQYNIPADAKTYIYAEEDEYFTFLWHYIMWSPDVYSGYHVDQENVSEFGAYDYILLQDQENQAIQDWVQKNYPEQMGNSVIVTSSNR